MKRDLSDVVPAIRDRFLEDRWRNPKDSSYPYRRFNPDLGEGMSLRRFVLLIHRWGGLEMSAVPAGAGSTGVVVWNGGGLLRKIAGRLHGRHHQSPDRAIGLPGVSVVPDRSGALCLGVLGHLGAAS